MVPALRLDQRIGPAAYIRPSLGVAGGNLERDLVTLRGPVRGPRRGRRVHRDAASATTPTAIAGCTASSSGGVLAADARPVVAVWGLAYKKDTRSTKNSMALRVIRDLRGRAEVRAYDPARRRRPTSMCRVTVLADRDAALVGADCLLDPDRLGRVRRAAAETRSGPCAARGHRLRGGDGSASRASCAGVEWSPWARRGAGEPAGRVSRSRRRAGGNARPGRPGLRGGDPRRVPHLPGGARTQVGRLRAAGLLPIVFTNQPEVARGTLRPETLEIMHARLRETVGVDDIFVCSHDDGEGCALPQAPARACCRRRPRRGDSTWPPRSSWATGGGTSTRAGRSAATRCSSSGLTAGAMSRMPRVADLAGAVDAVLARDRGSPWTSSPSYLAEAGRVAARPSITAAVARAWSTCSRTRARRRRAVSSCWASAAAPATPRTR